MVACKQLWNLVKAFFVLFTIVQFQAHCHVSHHQWSMQEIAHCSSSFVAQVSTGR